MQTRLHIQETGVPDFAQCGWVTDTRRFEVPYLLRLQGYGPVS